MSILTGSRHVEVPGDSELYSVLNEKTEEVEQSRSTSQAALQWRPSFHLTAPHGWLNDPCGLGYDPATGLYHLSFQWNPKGNEWGNISWGHSVSPDLVNWKTFPKPCLMPSVEYDYCGTFTGCLQPSNVNGDPGALTYVYTSVRHLPIHYTLPYVAGSESLSLAVSYDHGATWVRQGCNPILSGAPDNVRVTGWRDPYIGGWPSMRDQSSTSTSSSLYGFLSGGIVAETPTVFVYTVDASDLRKWNYVGPLVHVGLNFQPSRWSGDLGVNWEVANWLPLVDQEGTSRDFVIMGAEGCLECKNQHRMRTARSQLWMSVKLRSRREHSNPLDALATYVFSGIFDHGCCYAANSFWDPVTAQQIVYCWITEEDLPDNLRHQQGWSGVISLPRVVKLMTLHHVKKARSSDLEAITSIEKEGDSQGTYTVRTLGIQPDQRLEKLRTTAHEIHMTGIDLGIVQHHEPSYLSLSTSRWEMNAVFAVGAFCTTVGVEIGHSPDFSSRTVLIWEPTSEIFTVKRPQSHHPSINHTPETAPHTLFNFSDSDGLKEEPLQIHAYFDTSVLEVFVNERTVISTRIYLPHDHDHDQVCFGLRFFAESDESQRELESPAVLLHADIWDGLGV